MKILVIGSLLLNLLLIPSSQRLGGEILPANGVLVDVIFLRGNSYVVVTVDNWQREMFFSIKHIDPQIGVVKEEMTEFFPSNLLPNKTIIKTRGQTLHIFANWAILTFPNGQTRHYIWSVDDNYVFLPMVER